ncbi:hypothetical protein BWQ96_09745 [Gracilariopsis chorda]|uniref:Endonuclease/exonuclease/phosphatase domain-containing protein n=1 Tax=Gracilariopsis chorda TaxID=448386 RepID=A0A2V3IHD6_9FLOR|nr:hypothetical protein BWQ96_09745 [Gracilariopsis chorda]|eukprot:PXF40550.1 hypothetical protein BWQ96_09745 [Gracilariopsis chorda]
MNALNLDPCDGMKKFDALAEVVVKRLNQPDIVALQEIQDNDGSEQSGITSANKTLQMLSEAIVRTGGERYAVLDNPFIGDDTNGGQPGGNIRCAFLYAADRVKLVDVDTVVNSTEQRRNRQNAFYNSRLPLVGRFASVANGEVLTVINVHFSSKGGSAPIFGRVQPVEELQDNNVVNKGTDERVRQAQAVMRFVSEQRDEKVMVVGDFNEFEFNAALGVFKLGGMRVLTEDKVDRKDRYSFVFEGQGQMLDHVVVSSGLAERSLLQIVHCNAEFDERNRASDHEPLLASISLC